MVFGTFGYCEAWSTNGLGALEFNLLFCYFLTCNGLGALSCLLKMALKMGALQNFYFKVCHRCCSYVSEHFFCMTCVCICFKGWWLRASCDRACRKIRIDSSAYLKLYILFIVYFKCKIKKSLYGSQCNAAFRLACRSLLCCVDGNVCKTVQVPFFICRWGMTKRQAASCQ